MITQLIKVKLFEYQPKYSPLTTEFLTVTLFECQKASLVSIIESSIIKLSIGRLYGEETERNSLSVFMEI